MLVIVHIISYKKGLPANDDRIHFESDTLFKESKRVLGVDVFILEICLLALFYSSSLSNNLCYFPLRKKNHFSIR